MELSEVVAKISDGRPVRRSGAGYMVSCPVHGAGGGDSNPSLEVSRGTTQPVVLKCHAGCEVEDILAAADLSWADISEERQAPDPKVAREWLPDNEKCVAVYDYTDADGNLLWQVLRSESKRFFQRQRSSLKKSGWQWRAPDIERRVLYRLPEVVAAIDAGKEIWLPEGEKDVEALRLVGVTATCESGGAQAPWTPAYTESLRGARVTIVADPDTPGRERARRIRSELVEAECMVRIVEAAEGKDAYDHLIRHKRGLDEFVETVPYDEAPEQDLAVTLDEYLQVKPDPRTFVIQNVLAREEIALITGGEGQGKALWVETPIPTPTGWVTMADLSPGDSVFAPDGTPTTVIATTAPLLGRPCYDVTFSDGTVIVADADHQWVTETLPSREASAAAKRRGPTKPRGTDQRDKRSHWPGVVTTEEMRRTLLARGGHCLNHSIETCAPLQFPRASLPLDPYVLGAWLGDGSSTSARITINDDDEQIIDEIRSAGWVAEARGRMLWQLRGPNRWRGSIQAVLREMGVLGAKHVPSQYLVAAVDQRLALLQGLMDTDGTVGERGLCEFTSMNMRLADDVLGLALGLGIKATMHQGEARLNGRTVGIKYRITFCTDLPVFRLRRKAVRLTPRTTARHRLRYVSAVSPRASVPVRCIQVDHPSGMYVAGRECVPTHNSTFMKQVAVQVAYGIHPFTGARQEPRRVLFIDAENPKVDNWDDLSNLAGLALRHGAAPSGGGNLFIIETEPFDIASESGLSWLLERMHAHKPDLLVMGPLYNIVGRSIEKEDDARALKRATDMVRRRFRPAILLEHHMPHRAAGEDRDTRPLGSSLLMRWPAFGFGLAPIWEAVEGGQPVPSGVFTLHPWRGARRRTRAWPTHLRQGVGVEFPWVEADPMDVDRALAAAPRGRR